MKLSRAWLLLILGLGFSVAAVLILILPQVRPFKTSMTRSQEAQLLQPPAQAMNILLLGTDVVRSKVCNEQGFCAPANSLDGRSDTVLLIHIEPKLGKVHTVSIPRDSRVEIPGYGKHKINEANISGGALLAVQTVSQLFNALPINRYVRLNTLGVVDIINSLGGVRVNVKKAIHYSDDSQHLYINFPQGSQTLSGLQAQQYLRFRHDELGDIGRVQRQQEVLRALIDQALQPQTLLRLPRILEVLQQDVDTNLSLGDLLVVAQVAVKLDRKRDLQQVMLPGRFSAPGEYSSSFWIPFREKLPGLAANYLGWGERAAAKPVDRAHQAYIIVQNATASPLNTSKLKRYLRELGFRHFDLIQPYPVAIWHTQVIAQQGDVPLAEAVQQTLGLGEVIRDSTGQINSEITIRLGKDWAVSSSGQKIIRTPQP